MKTYVPSKPGIERRWWVVDAEGKTLGRLASVVASRLRGKHKPIFVPFLDTGDHVVVVNAERVRLTGEKPSGKLYRHHTGYPGGLKQVEAGKLLDRKPVRVIELAIKGMLPKGPLGRQMFRKLKVYAGPRHPHEAQKPEPLEFVATAGARKEAR